MHLDRIISPISFDTWALRPGLIRFIISRLENNRTFSGSVNTFLGDDFFLFRYDFETYNDNAWKIDGWKKITDEGVGWQIGSGLAYNNTGPRYDHTSQEVYGKSRCLNYRY